MSFLNLHLLNMLEEASVPVNQFSFSSGNAGHVLHVFVSGRSGVT